MTDSPLTGSGFGFGTLIDVETDEQTAPADPGDHDRFAHYVLKTQATEAFVMGTPLRALGGEFV